MRASKTASKHADQDCKPVSESLDGVRVVQDIHWAKAINAPIHSKTLRDSRLPTKGATMNSSGTLRVIDVFDAQLATVLSRRQNLLNVASTLLYNLYVPHDPAHPSRAFVLGSDESTARPQAAALPRSLRGVLSLVVYPCNPCYACVCSAQHF